jgi:hypothetical protein
MSNSNRRVYPTPRGSRHEGFIALEYYAAQALGAFTLRLPSGSQPSPNADRVAREAFNIAQAMIEEAARRGVV